MGYLGELILRSDKAKSTGIAQLWRAFLTKYDLKRRSINCLTYFLNVTKSLFLVFVICYCQKTASAQDSLSYFTSDAENAFLDGRVADAVANYVKAIEYAGNQINDDKTSKNLFKLIELLTITLKETGNCNTAIDYYQKYLTPTTDKVSVAKALREIIKCNNSWEIILHEDVKELTLQFFDLGRIGEAAHIQLSDYLSGSYSEGNEFNNFFYLLENGFVPALHSMDLEMLAKKNASLRGWLASGAIFLISLLGFLAYTLNTKRKHLIKEKVALLTGQEKETARLSIDLHDILGYKIVELKGQVNKLISDSSNEIEKISEGLDELHESMRYIVQSNLMHTLPNLFNLDLLRLLRHFLTD